MPYRKIDFSPPFVQQVGDIFPIDFAAGKIFQLRAGAVIAERHLALPGLSLGDNPPATFAGSVHSVVYYQETRPMTKTVTNVSVGGTGLVTFKFSDGQSRDVPTHADGVALADTLDVDGNLTENLLIAKAYRHSPDGTDLQAIVGSTATIDTAAANPVQFNFAPGIN